MSAAIMKGIRLNKNAKSTFGRLYYFPISGERPPMRTEIKFLNMFDYSVLKQNINFTRKLGTAWNTI